MRAVHHVQAAHSILTVCIRPPCHAEYEYEAIGYMNITVDYRVSEGAVDYVCGFKLAVFQAVAAGCCTGVHAIHRSMHSRLRCSTNYISFGDQQSFCKHKYPYRAVNVPRCVDQQHIEALEQHVLPIKTQV